MTTAVADKKKNAKKKDRAADGAKKSASKRKGYSARTADKYELYEKSVQEPEAEVDLIDQVWKEVRGRTCRSIREDFCGTAAVCMEWVKKRPDNVAIGVDLDPEVLGWGTRVMPERLDDEQRSRVDLIQENVLTVRTPKVDSVLAMNFSYYIFKTRPELCEYFKAARRALKQDGLLLLDAYGGSDSFSELEEDRKFKGFTYIWDQHSYDPITGHGCNYIHFAFPDGTKMKRAFEYQWRLWTLPEIQELLTEAGFSDVTIYWEGTDPKTGEGNGRWKRATRGDADPGWVAYIAAKA